MSYLTYKTVRCPMCGRDVFDTEIEPLMKKYKNVFSYGHEAPIEQRAIVSCACGKDMRWDVATQKYAPVTTEVEKNRFWVVSHPTDKGFYFTERFRVCDANGYGFMEVAE